MSFQDNLLANRYLVLDTIGEGGMGTVYRALDRQTGRDVALKILRSHLCQKQHSRERFAHEAHIRECLHHEGIVQIYDLCEDQRPFIVMELVTGLSWRQYVKDYHPNRMKVLRLAADLCSALFHAHSFGVIHRDLKPDNVFITHDEKIKIIDFGLAKYLNAPELTELTRSGTALGTCSYMSPEQATGSEADARSDLYSVGIMLYETFCGKPPFTAKDPASVLYKQVHEEPQPLRELCPNLEPELEELVLWMINKNPINRPQNAMILRDKILQLMRYMIVHYGYGEYEAEAPKPVPPAPALPAASQDAASAPMPSSSSSAESSLMPYDLGQPLSYLYISMPRLAQITKSMNNMDGMCQLISQLSTTANNSVQNFQGIVLQQAGHSIWNDCEVHALFYGASAVTRAYQAWKTFCATIDGCLEANGVNRNVPTNAGIFTDTPHYSSAEEGISDKDLGDLLEGAKRLEATSRSCKDELLLNYDCSQDRTESLRCQCVRELFLKNHKDPIKVFQVIPPK